MELTAEDRKMITIMRGMGILQNVEGHRLDRSNGVILITCADGDRFSDLFKNEVAMMQDQHDDPRVHVFGWISGTIRFFRNLFYRVVAMMQDQHDAPRVHVFGWNGGAIRLSHRPSKPVPDDLIDPFAEVAAARKMKMINTIALYAHAPCGAAYANHIGILTVIERQMMAKDNLKDTNPGVKVACFLHVHHAMGRDRTYFISRNTWNEKETELHELAKKS